MAPWTAGQERNSNLYLTDDWHNIMVNTLGYKARIWVQASFLAKLLLLKYDSKWDKLHIAIVTMNRLLIVNIDYETN